MHDSTDEEIRSVYHCENGHHVFKRFVDGRLVGEDRIAVDVFDKYVEDGRVDVGGKEVVEYLDMLREKERRLACADNDVDNGNDNDDVDSKHTGNDSDDVDSKHTEKHSNDEHTDIKDTNACDETGRAWLSLTHKHEYTPDEYTLFKLRNEISLLEKYIENRADILNEKYVHITYRRTTDTAYDPDEWTANEHATFLDHFSTFNKKFHIIARLMGRSTKSIIHHYYRTKRKERYNKRRSGRLSDTSLKILVDMEWTEAERNRFARLYGFYGKNWKEYEECFVGKSVCDFKNYFRYYSKCGSGRRGGVDVLMDVDRPAIVHTDSTDKPVMVNTDSTDKPIIGNGSDSTDKPVMVNTDSTDKPIIGNGSDSTDKPVIVNTGDSTGKSDSTTTLMDMANSTNGQHTSTDKSDSTTNTDKTRKQKVTAKRRPAVRRKPTKRRTPSTHSAPKKEKENSTNTITSTSNAILDEWTIDERQLFAIFYPYIGKNWHDLSQYITTKRPSDCRTYFKMYFKNLSVSEQKLEAAMRNVPRDTYTVPNSPRRLNDDSVMDDVGILFKK